MSYDAWKLDYSDHYDEPEIIPMCIDCGEELNHFEIVGGFDECRRCNAYNKMVTYKNIGRNSGILAYKSGNYYISILFSDWSFYRYTKASAGYNILREMQRLAKIGGGLGSFISRNKPDYVYKEKM